MVWGEYTCIGAGGGALSFYWVIIGIRRRGLPLCGPRAAGVFSQEAAGVPMLSSARGCRECSVLF